MSFIIIYVTHKNLTEAKKVGEELLKEKIIACANYFPIKASYWWIGEIESDDEYVSILKTRTEYWEKVKNVIENIHPYDTPCIMKIDVEANENYEKWIYQSTNAIKSDNY